ncbi:DoxX family protein [Egibacter rhizosphaerae]|uniref:DoxX family protein n=1 Tax=Egibacter rhizosphaerae TaxID=1670831 RepID=A0A411YFF7_9ACTN|nr:DoxX family protein [Egibacter rhizosphaerae]QBI19916.1 DoxX family protein [Egibacter rhizosphaerae]
MSTTRVDKPSGPEAHGRWVRLPVRPVWALRLGWLLGWFFAGAGVMRLLPVPFDVAMFADWGLSMGFRTLVGTAELAVGALALWPRTRPVGLIGIGVVMVSAGTVHAVLGHSPIVAMVLNGSLAAAAFGTAWALRAEILR